MNRGLSTSLLYHSLQLNRKQCFGKITNIIKGLLESVIKEQRDMQNKDISHVKTVPKNQVEAEKQYISVQQTVSNYQKQRMQRIDEELGTRTYFHQTKLYEERLDSEHIMQIRRLKRKFKQPSRSQLDWTNPQAPPKFKVKNRRKYSKSLKKLRSYPQHHEQMRNLGDQNHKGTIDFLGTQTLFTKLSLASVDLKIQSLESQQLRIDEDPMVTNRYAYFRAPYTHSLYRIQKSKYFPELAKSLQIFAGLQTECQEVVSIQYIYEILKQLDNDERVSEYLKKVENGKIDFIISDITFNETQNQAMIFIDLIGNKREYCAIYKNLLRNEESMKQEGSQNVIFNLKPKGFFQGSNFYFIQRSQESLFVELATWNCQSKQQSILYKCQPFREIQIISDSKRNFIFLKQTQIGGKFMQKLSVLDTYNQNDIKLYPMLPFQNYSYQVMTNEDGILVAKYKKSQNQRLKFGANDRYATEILLIPYKSERSLIVQAEEKINQQKPEYLPKSVRNKVSANQLDFSNIKVFFKCDQNEYIKDFQVRKTHTILNLTKFSVFNQNRLHFIPRNSNSIAHSLYLEGYPYELSKHDQQYDSQTLNFTLQTPLLATTYKYTIWKKQLQQTNDDKIHAQNMLIDSKHNKSLSIRVLCHQNFINQKTAVVLYCPSLGQKIDEFALRRLLMKGVMVVQFFGRGSLYKDAQYLMQGTGSNYLNYVQDLQSVLSFLGNNFSRSISIYTKGVYSSLILLLMNLKFPMLFNSTVLHNGAYDLDDQRILKTWDIFFGQGQQIKKQWSSLNPLMLSDKLYNSQEKQLELGLLENLMVSSDPSYRQQSRKLVLRLRNNKMQRYPEVYLKQHEDHRYRTDVYNLAYIYDKIRDSLVQADQSKQWEKQEELEKQGQKTK